jgi:hypothetical protein
MVKVVSCGVVMLNARRELFVSRCGADDGSQR